MDERTSSPSSQQSMDKPYKPKFHVYPGKSELGGAKNSLEKASPSPTVSVTTSMVTTSAGSVIQTKALNSGGNNFVVRFF